MRYFLVTIALILPLLASSQSTYVPLNKDYYQLLDRYEILNGRQLRSVHTSVKPYDRRSIALFLDSLTIDSASLSSRDAFNLGYLSDDNWEWADPSGNNSKKSILKYFYRKKSDLFSIHNEELDLHINPVLYTQVGNESDVDGVRYINSRGIELRGMIDNRIGFYTFATDNQAALPSYVNAYIADFKAVPGEGFYKPFKTTGVDFLTARGYITFDITKHIHFQFGHDKNFIGNGYRSLILSDFSANYTFLKINANVWKFNYMNLFTEMNAGVGSASVASNRAFPKKYLAFHHLSFNVTKNLNIGLFESVVFGREDSTKNGQFDINYLNPIIFYRSIEQHLGSSDNAILGMDYKWNFLRHFSFYGQIVLDEFFLKEIKARKGWWANKQALQTGLKYINAFGINNLDLQGEFNVVRPYTYAHASGYTNYTHYNQSLAHPIGANFYEFIGIARYQPLKRLSLTGKAMLISFGADSNTVNTAVGSNNGGNATKSYLQIAQGNTYGNEIGQGIKTTTVFVSFNASWMVRHNLFVDFTQVIRKSDSEWDIKDSDTFFTSVALRWNIPQRLNEF